MRINRQTLLKITNDTVEKRAKETRSLLAVYMHGSMNLEEEPFLFESTDIDLVFIHEYEVEMQREIIRITDEITFDIRHESRTLYRVPRELRSHPWLGPAIYSFKILHDPRHFLDFAQAGLRDQYFRPSNVLGRARAFSTEARAGWMSLLTGEKGTPAAVNTYLEAAAGAANAIASLNGDPMPERRLLTQFFERMEAIGQPGLYPKLLELLGAGAMDETDLGSWSAAWERAYDSAFGSAADEGLAFSPERKAYYLNALQAQLASDRPADALWPLLRTWSLAAGRLAEGHPARAEWEQSMQQIGLLGAGQPERLEALDGLIDLIEEMLEGWGNARGVDAY